MRDAASSQLETNVQRSIGVHSLLTASPCRLTLAVRASTYNTRRPCWYSSIHQQILREIGEELITPLRSVRMFARLESEENGRSDSTRLGDTTDRKSRSVASVV